MYYFFITQNQNFGAACIVFCFCFFCLTINLHFFAIFGILHPIPSNKSLWTLLLGGDLHGGFPTVWTCQQLSFWAVPLILMWLVCHRFQSAYVLWCHAFKVWSLSFDGPRQKQFSGAKCQETNFFCFQVGPWTSLDPEGGGFRKPPSYGWIQDEVRNWVRVGVRG